MIEVIRRSDRIKIREKVEQFGIKIPIQYQLVRQSRDKIRIFTGNLGAQDLIRLNKIITIDAIGLYFAFMKEKEFRLSFDASILYGKNSKNFIELSEEEAKAWLKGEDIEKKTDKKGYFLVRYGGDILGCGKSNGEKLTNFVPKERRITI
ncbi:MAG: methyltransferase RsmF C-terminal domain-like protein [Candidatus Pacearchaeota archaeon]